MWISLNVIVNFHFTLLHEKFPIPACVGEAGSSEAVLGVLAQGKDDIGLQSCRNHVEVYYVFVQLNASNVQEH